MFVIDPRTRFHAFFRRRQVTHAGLARVEAALVSGARSAAAARMADQGAPGLLRSVPNRAALQALRRQLLQVIGELEAQWERRN